MLGFLTRTICTENSGAFFSLLRRSLFRSAITEPAAWRSQSHCTWFLYPPLPRLPSLKEKVREGKGKSGKDREETGHLSPWLHAALPTQYIRLPQGSFSDLCVNDLLFLFTDFLLTHHLLLLQLFSLNFPPFTDNLKDKHSVFTHADTMPQISGKQGSPSVSLVC